MASSRFDLPQPFGPTTRSVRARCGARPPRRALEAPSLSLRILNAPLSNGARRITPSAALIWVRPAARVVPGSIFTSSPFSRNEGVPGCHRPRRRHSASARPVYLGLVGKAGGRLGRRQSAHRRPILETGDLRSRRTAGSAPGPGSAAWRWGRHRDLGDPVAMVAIKPESQAKKLVSRRSARPARRRRRTGRGRSCGTPAHLARLHIILVSGFSLLVELGAVRQVIDRIDDLHLGMGCPSGNRPRRSR